MKPWALKIAKKIYGINLNAGIVLIARSAQENKHTGSRQDAADWSHVVFFGQSQKQFATIICAGTKQYIDEFTY